MEKSSTRRQCFQTTGILITTGIAGCLRLSENAEQTEQSDEQTEQRDEQTQEDTASDSVAQEDLPNFSELSNWPMMNHDAKNSGWNPSFQDPEIGGILSKRWEYEAGGRVTAPAVVDNYVSVGSRDAKAHTITVGRGSEHWTFRLPSIITNSTAVQNGTVLVAPTEDYIVGLDLSQGGRSKGFSVVSSTPIVSEGNVYFTSSDDGGGVYCYSQENAELLWRTDANPYISVPPAVGNNSVFVSGQDGEVYAINKSSGDILWQVETQDEDEPTQLEPPVVSESTVFIGHSGMGEGKLQAFNTNNGNKRWEHTVTSNRPEDERPPLDVRSYVCNKNNVFFSSKFEVSKINKDTGSFEWTTNLRGVINDLALSDDWLYATPYQGGIYRIDRNTGEESQIVENESQLESTITAISIANRQLFVSNGKWVISYGNLSEQ